MAPHHHGPPTTPKNRVRTNSSGSTRDVFYHGNVVPKRAEAPKVEELATIRRRRKKKKEDAAINEVAPLPFTEPRGMKPGTLSPAGVATRRPHDYLAQPQHSGYGATANPTVFESNNNLMYSNDPEWLAALRIANEPVTHAQESSFQHSPLHGYTSHEYTLSFDTGDDDDEEEFSQATSMHSAFSVHVPQPLTYFAHHYFYNPDSPEFSSLQQFNWSIVLGLVMGVFSAFWKTVIEGGVDFFWETLPKLLLDWGVFNEFFPLFHYMWILPSLSGGILSYCVAIYDFPDQNEWISSLHSRGVQEHKSFFALFALATVGMWSGLSLGPELPLVLTSGMAGSWLALVTKQSMLQARVLNITAASAAIGGFFGFPLAGALFVLELPHRMGLQYFEAMSPAVVASIVAVVTKAQITGEEVAGYFRYPFLSPSLPSSIYYIAIVIGFYGCAVGLVYAYVTKFLKGQVHDWFHAATHDNDEKPPEIPSTVHDGTYEVTPLLTPDSEKSPAPKRKSMADCFSISAEPKRAAVAGAVAGAMVGWIGVFLPHVMFWGEAQLQNLIDKGRTELPVFGESGTVAASSMIRHAVCMIGPNDDEELIVAGFGIGCSFLIAFAKTVVIGLSLGTGIIGGHFWGPLYVGCAMAHFLVDVVEYAHHHYGVTKFLVAYPCMVILGTMGAAHVVSFRAPFGIILILALTISTFDDSSSGDFAAVVPYLVFAVKIALMTSRDLIVFYASQRERGDINPVPELLCQPGMEGAPLIVRYDRESGHPSTDDTSHGTDSKMDEQDDVEMAISDNSPRTKELLHSVMNLITESDKNSNSFNLGDDPKSAATDSNRLDELLGISSNEQQSPQQKPSAHRRTRSVPIAAYNMPPRPSVNGKPTEQRERIDSPLVGNRERAGSSSSQKGALVRINSFGDIQEHQPSLLDQARMRSASSAEASSSSNHRRVPSLPRRGTNRHSRKHSDSSFVGIIGDQSESGALSMDDIDMSFSAFLG